jgi:hypothetical protein
MKIPSRRPSPHEGEKQTPRHGSDRSSPYPVSRLAPAFQSVDLAAEVALAESFLSARTGAKLRIVADQIKALQAQARKILDEAREERTLAQAQCGFKRIPGHTYHLYRKEDGGLFFSMLSPADWRGKPPYPFLGSYRLETDYSWTPARPPAASDETGDLVAQLLRIGGISEVGE